MSQPRPTRPRFRPLLARLRTMQRDERGGVAVMAALSITPLLAGAAITVEFNNWGANQVQLQRAADIAAYAGAQGWISSSNSATAEDLARRVAFLNSAGSTPVAQVTTGTRDKAAKAVLVTVTKAVPFVMAQSLGLGTSINLYATAKAEVTTSTAPGTTAAIAPACILALKTKDQNGQGIAAQGSVIVNLTGCGLRSNADISAGGSAKMTASGFYATGSVNPSGLTGDPKISGLPLIADPYGDRTALQTALTNVSSAGGQPLNVKSNGSASLQPGLWSRWDISGDVTLAPGLYRVAGDISMGAQGTLTGNGVTIIAGGSFGMQGGSTVTLTASKEADVTGGAMAGIVFASKSSNGSVLRGNTKPRMTGVVYYPKGDLDFGGTPVGGSNGCLQVVAGAVPLNGNPTLASTCTGYNVATISIPTPPTPPPTSSRPIVLVQ